MKKKERAEVISQESLAAGIYSMWIRTDAAAEAITAEMQAAMMKYMPLRGSFSFASGSVTPQQLQEVLDKLNG